MISIHDVVSDTMHQFAPTYHNYVLYSNGGSKDAPKTVRCAPQCPAALLASAFGQDCIQTKNLRLNSRLFGLELDLNMQLACWPGSGTILAGLISAEVVS